MEEDQQQFLGPVWSTGSESNFKPLNTIPAFSFHLLISMAISVTGIGLAMAYSDPRRCEAYFIMLYLRAAFWIITFFFDHIVKHQHETLRLNGYLDFHRATSAHKGAPLYLVSLWNTAILTIQTFLQHYYGSNFAVHCIQSYFSPLIYVTAFSTVETFILCAINGSYIGEKRKKMANQWLDFYITRVRNFNRMAPPPDALRGSHSIGGTVGLSQPGADMADLFEKQADLINYLKDHNFKLNQKLMQLNAQVRTVSIS